MSRRSLVQTAFPDFQSKPNQLPPRSTPKRMIPMREEPFYRAGSGPQDRGKGSQARAADIERSARFAWRVGVLIVGLFLLIIGIIMIFTPGPAMVFIPAGLALLATEFEWARRILHRVRPLIDAAIEKAKRKKEELQARRNAKKAGSSRLRGRGPARARPVGARLFPTPHGR